MLRETAKTDTGLAEFLENFLTAVDFQEQVVVSGHTRLEDLAEWDSLAALGVIVMCDTEYDVTLTGEDLKKCATITDIYTVIVKKRG